MENFTLVSATVGGALIGLAATLLMLLNARVAGISGIFAACLNLRGRDRGWSAAFLAGLILAPLTAILVRYPVPEPQMPESWIVIVVAGVLVGFGTRLGGGCTSGHACAGWRGCPRGRSLPLSFSWRARWSWSRYRVM
jgi:uncharacterized protein